MIEVTHRSPFFESQSEELLLVWFSTSEFVEYRLSELRWRIILLRNDINMDFKKENSPSWRGSVVCCWSVIMWEEESNSD
jgi:hypothetical protein